MSDHDYTCIDEYEVRFREASDKHFDNLNDIVCRHIKALAGELAVEFADSFESGAVIGDKKKKYVRCDPEATGKDDLAVTDELVHFTGSGVEYQGFLGSTVRLEGRMTGTFPFDIEVRVKPYDYKRRCFKKLNIAKDLISIYLESEMPEEYWDNFEDELCKINDCNHEIFVAIRKLEVNTDSDLYENNEEEFWKKANEISDMLKHADGMLCRLGGQWPEFRDETGWSENVEVTPR